MIEIKYKYYDLSMAGLALVVVIMLIMESTLSLSVNTQGIMLKIDNCIWLIFLIDYTIRLYKSENKKNFIINNKIDLISIIPFNSLFKVLRVFKIARVIKIAKITKVLKATIFLSKFRNKLDRFMRTNNLNYVVYLTVGTVIAGAIVFSIVEGVSLGDSLWWSFVTTTTVGYGDISPVTTAGRIVASILMVIGIGFIGMLTGTIATFFIKKDENVVSYKDNVIRDIKDKLDKFDDLSKEDIKSIYKVLNSLKD